jgi:hypothetical protein
MDRPVPPLTPDPCNTRTMQAFLLALRVRTVPAAAGDSVLINALLAPAASLAGPVSRGCFHDATTGSRRTRHAALNARRATGVVNA